MDILFYQQTYVVVAVPAAAAAFVDRLGWFQNPEQPQTPEYLDESQAYVIVPLIQVSLGWLHVTEDLQPQQNDQQPPDYVIVPLVQINLGWHQVLENPQELEYQQPQDTYQVFVLVQLSFGWYQQISQELLVEELRLEPAYELHGVGVVFVPPPTTLPFGWYQQLDQPDHELYSDFFTPSFHRTIDSSTAFEPIRRRVGESRVPGPLDLPSAKGSEPL